MGQHHHNCLLHAAAPAGQQDFIIDVDLIQEEKDTIDSHTMMSRAESCHVRRFGRILLRSDVMGSKPILTLAPDPVHLLVTHAQKLTY
eukprot:1932882-Amphidinium_carterae.1